MTYEQAVERIVEKTLSLVDGWKLTHDDIIGSSIERCYTHPTLEGFGLRSCHQPGIASGSTVTIRTAHGDFISSDARLVKHLDVIKGAITKKESEDFAGMVIKLAEKL